MSRRGNVISVAVFLIAVLLIFLISPSNRQRLRSGFLSVISPFLKSGSSMDQSYRRYKAQVKKLEELEVENAGLKTRIEQLELEESKWKPLQAENKELRDAVGYVRRTPFKFVAARVIGRPVTNWWHTIVVDKGAADGITADMAVLTPKGLVGKVIGDPGAHASTVLLVTDETCRVPARVEGTTDDGRQGIVHVEVRGERSASNQQPQMKLRFLSKSASLQKDMRIVTSAASHIYPPNISVGKVVDFKSRELDGEATIEPEVDLAVLADVFIVTEDKTPNVPR
jgi:rod shape-determining protein MreC